MSVKIINANSLQWQEVASEHFSYSRKQLGVPAGGKMLGASLYKLRPNTKAFPYHFHYANEEAIFVLEGEGTLRLVDKNLKITQGDYIAIPKGQQNPHQMINTSEKPLVYLCFSTMIAPDVMEYPDSNKVGIMAGSAPGGDKAKQLLKAFYKKDQQVEQRFFALFELDFVAIARWIFALFFIQTDKFYLIIDRTNWYWGKKKINVFMLSVAYEGLAIPLFWTLLDKGGSSNFKEQKSLLEQFIRTFGTTGIAGLLADREFPNGQFLQWLNKKNIPFYIRIKENTHVLIKGKKLFSAKEIFNPLPPKHSDCYGLRVEIFHQAVYLAGSRSERGELMIVATNQSPKNAIPIYLRRWEIENLFQGLKGRGFRFEETHITHQERIAKLLVLLAVGFVWAHKVGEWQALKKPILFKKFSDSRRPQSTFFRYGLDVIREILLKNAYKTRSFTACVRLLCYPDFPGEIT